MKKRWRKIYPFRKGKAVQRVELARRLPLHEILELYESWKTPMRIVAEELGVHIQTVNFWRYRLGFKKRK